MLKCNKAAALQGETKKVESFQFGEERDKRYGQSLQNSRW